MGKFATIKMEFCMHRATPASSAAGLCIRFFKNIKKNFPFALILIFLLYQGCTHKFGIDRGIKTSPRFYIEEKKDSCSLIRNKNFDLYIEPITDNKWLEKLLTQEIFTKKMSTPETRVPRLNMFQLLVSNEGDCPLTIDFIKIIYGQVEIQPLSLEEIKKRTKSPVFDAFDFKKILSEKRYLGKKYCIRDIEYDRNTLDYRFDFINPGDKILKIVIFDWIPVQYRNFKLQIKLSCGAEGSDEKTISFDFDRYEYRTSGKYFKGPDKKKKED